MNFRIKMSVMLVSVGILLALLPANNSTVFKISPPEFLEKSLSNEYLYSVDQIAKFVKNEDSTILLIDVRSKEDYQKSNIPGSINIPMSDILNSNWQGYLNQEKVKNVFYSNGNINAIYAWAITTGLGYKNNYVMAGGLNEWYKTIMLTNFKGGSITPRENTLFENRLKARKLFTQLNSLPDSLKFKFLAAKRVKETELDGGCE